jgi:hypothetical protein
MLMSDSIGGNAKTLMFVNTSPADYNSAESNSSLAFASRCKDVTNQVASAPGVQAAQVHRCWHVLLIEIPSITLHTQYIHTYIQYIP